MNTVRKNYHVTWKQFLFFVFTLCIWGILVVHATGNTTGTGTGNVSNNKATQTTTQTGSANAQVFRLEEAKVLDVNTVLLVFSEEIFYEEGDMDAGTVVITPTDDIQKELAISKIELFDAKSLKVTLKDALQASKEYTVTVRFIFDKNAKNTIEAGENGMAIFKVPETATSQENTNKNTFLQVAVSKTGSNIGTGVQQNQKNNSTTINMGTSNKNNVQNKTEATTTGAQNTQSIGNGSVEIATGAQNTPDQNQGIENQVSMNAAGEEGTTATGANVEDEAQKTNKLPATGPETVWILLLSFVLAGMLVIFLKRRYRL